MPEEIHFRFSIRRNDKGEIEARLLAPTHWQGVIDEFQFKHWLEWLNKLAAGEDVGHVVSPELVMRSRKQDESKGE